MFASWEGLPEPTTLRGRVVRWGFSIQILATVFLMSLRVEVSCDSVRFRTISSHPARAIRVFVRFQVLQKEGMEDKSESWKGVHMQVA